MEVNRELLLILVSASKKASIESTRQQFFDRTLLGFALQVCEYDRRVLAKLPNNLPAGAAGRCQRFRIGDNREFSKVPFAFRQRLPDGNAFTANSQTITGAFDIAAGINFSIRGSRRSANQEI